MIITNKQNLPQALVNAVSSDRHNRKGCLSATTILKGTKEVLLSQRHWEEMSDDASNRIFALFGTAVHSVFESKDDKDGVIRETEFTTPVGKYTLTGRIDRYDPETKTLSDYKVTSVYKILNGNVEDWYKQLMIYSYLMQLHGIEVKHCVIHAVLRDWSRADYRRKASSGYPETQVTTYSFDPKEEDFDFIKKFIEERISDISKNEEVEDDLIPDCSEHERWAKPDKYAVIKEGATKATKLLDTKEEAESYLLTLKDKKDFEKYKIEFRKGESGKCENYCSCCQFCSFYKKNCSESK